MAAWGVGGGAFSCFVVPGFIHFIDSSVLRPTGFQRIGRSFGWQVFGVFPTLPERMLSCGFLKPRQALSR
jgi:hypothetical protein